MEDLHKCEHPACNCMTTEEYCSTSCSDAGDTLEIACNCGHPGCKERMAAKEEEAPKMPLPPLI